MRAVSDVAGTSWRVYRATGAVRGWGDGDGDGEARGRELRAALGASVATCAALKGKVEEE